MRAFFYFCLLVLSHASFSQSEKPLTIEDCYTLAKQYYPLAKQRELIEKSKEYSIENASKGYLPQVNIGGQATYQSDVTKVPISLPNVTIPTLTKDQYKVFGEIVQPLTDALVIKEQKELITTNAVIEDQKLEVELYKLKERINQLFFGVLLMDEQLKQVGLLKKDIQNGIEKMNAALANGTAFRSSVDILKSELLKTDQRGIEFRSARKAYMDMLGLLINKTFDETTTLEKPQNKVLSQGISRPEVTLFDHQAKSFDSQDKLLTAKNFPRISLFFQEGYGKPGLNMLSNTFDSYYIGGVRFNWSLTSFYTLKKERMLLDVSRNILTAQKETFLFNTALTLQQNNNEITKLQELIKLDADIVALRTGIKNSANAQLENGVITANDYLREVNAEDQSKQNLLLHQVQLLTAEYNYQTTAGN
jgi:outer membrane protein TolC